MNLKRIRMLAAAKHNPVTWPPREIEKALRDAGCPSQVRAHGRGQPGMLAYDERERVRGSGGGRDETT